MSSLALLEPLLEQRLLLSHYERKYRFQSYFKIAGVDEAGRGPLAGPVVAAACIFLRASYIEGINDSKKLSEKKREELFEKIISHPDVVYAITEISAQEIDEINILEASRKAMHESVKKLSTKADFLLVDALTLPLNIPSLALIKGDAKSFSIAAASILAKVYRDRIMKDLDKLWPEYGFAKHKGYGTLIHREALKSYGPCPEHRKSFAPVRKATESLARSL